MGGILHRKQPLATGAGAFTQERGGSAAAAAASAAAAADRHGVSVQGTVYSVHRSPVLLQLTSEPFVCCVA